MAGPRSSAMKSSCSAFRVGVLSGRVRLQYCDVIPLRAAVKKLSGGGRQPAPPRPPRVRRRSQRESDTRVVVRRPGCDAPRWAAPPRPLGPGAAVLCRGGAGRARVVAGPAERGRSWQPCRAWARGCRSLLSFQESSQGESCSGRVAPAPAPRRLAGQAEQPLIRRGSEGSPFRRGH